MMPWRPESRSNEPLEAVDTVSANPDGVDY